MKVKKQRVKKHKGNPVMRAKEVQQMLGIGRNTLYNWCELGIIPCKRVGRVILFSRERIRQWVDNEEKSKEVGNEGAHRNKERSVLSRSINQRPGDG